MNNKILIIQALNGSSLSIKGIVQRTDMSYKGVEYILQKLKNEGVVIEKGIHCFTSKGLRYTRVYKLSKKGEKIKDAIYKE